MSKNIAGKFTKGGGEGAIILGSFLKELRNLGHEEKFSEERLQDLWHVDLDRK